MAAKYRSENELEDIARELMEVLRPKHLSVGQIKAVAGNVIKMTEFIVFQEKPAESE